MFGHFLSLSLFPILLSKEILFVNGVTLGLVNTAYQAHFSKFIALLEWGIEGACGEVEVVLLAWVTAFNQSLATASKSLVQHAVKFMDGSAYGCGTHKKPPAMDRGLDDCQTKRWVGIT